MKLLQNEVYQLVHRGGRAVDLIEVNLDDFTLKTYLLGNQILHRDLMPLHDAPEHVGPVESDPAFETI